MPTTLTLTAICGLVLLILGGVICLGNVYLSFIRYPLFRLFGGVREDYQWSSGIPLIGSAMVAIAAICLLNNTTLFWLAIGLIVIDTGGLHWFLGAMVHEWIASRRSPPPGGTERTQPYEAGHCARQPA